MKKFTARKVDLKRGFAKYCSRKCFGQRPTRFKNKPANVICAYCNTNFYKSKSKLKKSKSGLHFCNRTCKDQAQGIGGLKAIQPAHYGNGGGSYRKRAFKHYPNKCNRCDYNTYISVLKVHHKDRDRTNHTLTNLEILCPTCHDEDHFLAKDGIYTTPSWLIK
jgi:hypothetical protein